jgi:hypothetical protein
VSQERELTLQKVARQVARNRFLQCNHSENLAFIGKSGAPGGTRTLGLLVRRGIFSYTPTHRVQQEPMKSTRETESFRLVSEGFVHRSRTITRTISAHQALSTFGQLRLLVEVSTSRPRSLSGFRRVRRGPRKGEAKVISAVQAEHDSVGHLLESRYAAATVEVSEALRERECRSIDNADVIEREVLAGFAAPLDSYLRVAAHGRARKLETASTGSTPGIICGAGLAFARAWYSWLEGLAATVRKYRPVRFRSHRNQCGLGDNYPLVLSHCCKCFVAHPSDCLPDVLQQVCDSSEFAGECPSSVRVSESSAHAS